MAPAFAAPISALPLRAPRAARVSTPHCSAVDENYPAYLRNAAPHISFDGVSGIRFSMARVKAFTEDTGEEPLFADVYGEVDWAAKKPVPAGPIAWPAGDGRDVNMTGTKGFFTVRFLGDGFRVCAWLRMSCFFVLTRRFFFFFCVWVSQVGNDKEYKEAPRGGFFKRSMDG